MPTKAEHSHTHIRDDWNIHKQKHKLEMIMKSYSSNTERKKDLLVIV